MNPSLSPSRRFTRRLLALAAVLALGACAQVDIDRELADLNPPVPGLARGDVTLVRDAPSRAAREDLAARLLSQPLGQDDAVRLALVHSPDLQVLLAEHWQEMAAADASRRPLNPLLSLERVRSGDELEIGRLVSVGLLDLLTLPLRGELAQQRQAQARVRLAQAVVDHAGATRQAWVRAVAAAQTLGYARQVHEAAQASAELARRMQAVGNFSALQRARQQAFHADAAARLAQAQHAATAAREALVRQLGLDEAQAARLRLPARLPDLPAQPRQAAEVASQAREQRLDWQMARLQLDAAGRAQRLELLHRLVDVDVGVRRDTRFHGAERSTAQGVELEVRLPLFDWGQAQRQAMSAQSVAAAHRYDAVARSAASQLREGYSAYRTAWDIARHYRDEIVPLRQSMSQENLLRYSGMFIGVFELLADTREQIASVMAAIEAQQQFWLADAALSAALVGRPLNASAPTAPGGVAAAGAGAAH